MSVYSDWIQWEASCRERPGFGITAGDTMHRGLGDYNALRPCPNGLPIDRRPPGECQAWRERIERARMWIKACNQSATRDAIAEQLTDEDVFNALERITKWAQ